MVKSMAILGCGHMAQALFGASTMKELPFKFYTYTPTHVRAQELAQKLGGVSLSSLEEMPACDVIFLGMKPQQFLAMGEELAPQLQHGPLILSVLAGVTTQKIQQLLKNPKVVRVMPNTPSLVGAGTSLVYAANSVSVEENLLVHRLLQPVSKVFQVEQEEHIEELTSLCASGPAYFFEMARIFEDYLVGKGFDLNWSRELVKETIWGSGELLHKSPLAPLELRNQVTSKGGVTQRALQELSQAQWEKILQKALHEGTKRAIELGKVQS